MENSAPTVHSRAPARAQEETNFVDEIPEEFDSREIFDLIRVINDPEHPLTLEELNVVREGHVEVKDSLNEIRVQFTPTIPHCSMATLIGLCIRVKLLRSLPPRFKVAVEIFPDSHVSRDAVNKQLADKERVAAALENSYLREAVEKCLSIKQSVGSV